MSEQATNNGARQALRTFRYGLYVLTCGQGTEAHAATISWVTQISFTPRRVALGVRKDSHIYAELVAGRTFALNVIAEGQEGLASAFFRYVVPREDQIAGHGFENGPTTGAPLLLDALAWLECRLVEEANTEGDHGLFVADVLAGAVRHPELQPLDLYKSIWSYGG